MSIHVRIVRNFQRNRYRYYGLLALVTYILYRFQHIEAAHEAQNVLLVAVLEHLFPVIE